MAEQRRAVGWRQVLAVAAIAVAAVLATQVVATIVPPIGDVVRGTPVVVIAMVAVTGWVLWRIAARRPPEA